MPKKSLPVIIDDPVKMDNDEIQAQPLAEPKAKRVVSAETAEHLKAGREKLKLIWAEKRKAKEELHAKALQKAVDLEIRKRETVKQLYNVETLDSDEEEEEEEEAPPPKKKKEKPSAKPILKSKAKPIKKPVRYVEESEDSEEEEEVVYVKKQKKAPTMVAQPAPASRIVFY